MEQVPNGKIRVSDRDIPKPTIVDLLFSKWPLRTVSSTNGNASVKLFVRKALSLQ
jgi:hypothetical protein